ncbi:MAG: hypothetical protein JWO03_2981 [Bacteroidetes bacterium]|nr:hypothetical protein [Bacteroidota bacterium]
MYKNFFLKLLTLTIIAALSVWILQERSFFVGYLSFVWISLAFLTCVTFAVYLIMMRALAMKAHTNFIIAFGTAFAIKSFASLAFLSYFIFFQPIVNKNFIFPFFAMYFLYTGLLVSHIWLISKKKPLP